MSRPHEREVCARRSDSASDARRNAMQIEARGRARNARAAAGSLCTGENLVATLLRLRALTPSSLPTTQVADCFAAECGGTLIRARDAGTHCTSGPGQSASGVTRSRRDFGRVRRRFLTMLGARPQFINAAPITM